MKIKFKISKEYVDITIDEKSYRPLELLTNAWTLHDVELCKKALEEAKINDKMEDFSIDGRFGFIHVFPDDQTAGVYEFNPQYPQNKGPLLQLTLDEVLDFLEMLEDFIKIKNK